MILPARRRRLTTQASVYRNWPSTRLDTCWDCCTTTSSTRSCTRSTCRRHVRRTLNCRARTDWPSSRSTASARYCNTAVTAVMYQSPYNVSIRRVSRRYRALYEFVCLLTYATHATQCPRLLSHASDARTKSPAVVSEIRPFFSRQTPIFFYPLFPLCSTPYLKMFSLHCVFHILRLKSLDTGLIIRVKSFLM